MNLTKENKTFNRKFVLVLISILLLSTFSSLLFIKNHSLVAHDESLYASRAKLILDTNNWFTPFDQAHHKTIGSYWLTSLSFKVLGFNEFSARLPSYIFSISSIFVLFKIIKLLSNLQIAYISVITLSSSYLWFSYSNYCSPDTLYICLNLLGIYNLLSIDKYLNENVKNKYLFFTGLFFVLPFFVRSYMQLLPLLSLSPFIFTKIYKLSFKNIKYIIMGLIVGLIPLIIYVLISFKAYGIESFIKPYQLLHFKVLNESNIIEGFTFYPRNLILFSFPFFIFIINGTKFILRKRSKELFLLFICAPLINIFILMLSASNYSHYALFLVPLLASNASFGIYECYINNSSISKITLIIFGLFSAIVSISIFLILLFNSYFNIQVEFSLLELLGILSLVLISVILSISIFLNAKFKYFNVNKILSIFLIYIILFSYLFGKGAIGNPNNNFKQFINQKDIHEIVENNRVNLIGNLDDKSLHLLKFYLPSYKRLQIDKISNTDSFYGFISDEDIINSSNFMKLKVIKKYENINFIKFN